MGKSRGNEQRRWHGTVRMCNIGDPGVTEFCSNPSCSLCSIMRTSFDISFFGQRTNFGRFGAGIYASATSSKSVSISIKHVRHAHCLTPLLGFLRADSYSYNGCTSNWKAMLLSHVIIGRGYKVMSDNVSLTQPPPGYDSVSANLDIHSMEH
jgi:hypothetical protein